MGFAEMLGRKTREAVSSERTKKVVAKAKGATKSAFSDFAKHAREEIAFRQKLRHKRMEQEIKYQLRAKYVRPPAPRRAKRRRLPPEYEPRYQRENIWGFKIE